MTRNLVFLVLAFTLNSLSGNISGWPDGGEGFQQSPDFGLTYTASAPWLWTPQDEWFYYQSTPNGGWRFDGVADWRWVPQQAYPLVYSPAVGWAEEDIFSFPGLGWMTRVEDGMTYEPMGIYRYQDGRLATPYSRELFLRGTFNNWGNSGLDGDDLLRFAGDARYQTVVALAAGDYTWKVGDRSWTTTTNFGYGGVFEIGQPVQLQSGASSPDISMSIADAGHYLFELDAASPNSPLIMVSKDSSVGYVQPAWTSAPHASSAGFQAIGGGLFVSELELGRGQHQLQIGAVDRTDWGLGIAAPVQGVQGSRYLLQPQSSAGSITVHAPVSAIYRFSIHQSTPQPELEVLLVEIRDSGPFGAPLQVRGFINGSELVSTMAFENGRFVWDAPIAAGTHTFRFTTGEGGVSIGAAVSAIVSPGSDTTLAFNGPELQLTLSGSEAGAYRVLIETQPDGSRPVLKILKQQALTVHYLKDTSDYTGWGLHIWNSDGFAVAEENQTAWPLTRPFEFRDANGAYTLLPLTESTGKVGFVVHKNGAERDIEVVHDLADGKEIWLVEGLARIILSESDALQARKRVKLVGPRWLTDRAIAWLDSLPQGSSYRLFADPDGIIEQSNGNVTTGPNGSSYDLPLLSDSTLRNQVLNGYPYANTDTLLDSTGVPSKDQLAKGLVVVAAYDGSGNLVAARRAQLYGLLDSLFSYDGQLGLVWGAIPKLRVWAPTARNMQLQRYSAPSAGSANSSSQPFVRIMDGSRFTGVWEIDVERAWIGQYYHLLVDVFVPLEQQVVTNVVTDPYSYGLSSNSRYSLIVDLDDANLKPAGWDQVRKPGMAPEDITIYELHVRDFSIADETVPQQHRGTFMAFTHNDSNGMQHLRRLANAGLSHVQLIPIFDFATTDENGAYLREFWPRPTGYPAASPEPQRIVMRNRSIDGFNWGYDPVHYFVPEGSYATNPDDISRIVELRRAVMGLHNAGLRLVQDVVFNHTSTVGQANLSVLDKVVPGYYYRFDDRGAVHTDACCPELMSENRMMEKLMVDAMLTWAKHYKVDAFRFDLMGDHTVDNILKAYVELAELTLEQDGVDGQNLYIFGEGWRFGSLLNYREFQSAYQDNLGGTGIGSFNDRFRDSIGHTTRGGFIDGIFSGMDRLRSGLAGNLRTVGFPGVGSGGTYTEDPEENVNHVTVHDNYTLWDEIILRNGSASSTAADRERMVRMHRLALSLVSVGQGVAFYHAGVDIHRSKSGDRNSYDSGDWFNWIDWTQTSNHFGRGLPPDTDDANVANYPVWQATMPNQNLQLTSSEISTTHEFFQELLQLRNSSPLFRLRSANEIANQVAFLNVGVGAVPGLIAYSITDDGPDDLDPDREWLLVLANGNSSAVTYSLEGLLGPNQVVEMHPLMKDSADPLIAELPDTIVGNSVTVPGKTLIVLQSDRLPNSQDVGGIAPYSVPVYLRGTMNDWGNTGLTAADEFAYQGNDKYVLIKTLSRSGSHQFKVADATWGDVNLGSSSGAMQLGVPKQLMSVSFGDLSLNFPDTGPYRFELDAKQKSTPTLTISKVN